MATARAIITDALTELGVLGESETASAGQAALGLLRLQNMIDAWQADRLTLAVQFRTTFTLLPGTDSITIGLVGADIIQARPVWINTVNFIIPGSSPEVESVLAQMNEDTFSALSIKQLSNALPTNFFYQTSMSTILGTISFWPVVNQSVKIAIYGPESLAVPLSLNSIITAPAGYMEALVYQLALRLASPFGVQPSQSLVEMAARAFATAKRANVKPGILGVDSALWYGSRGGAYNILSDQG